METRLKLTRAFFLKDWPVNHSWYQKHLKCILSGSTNEVYETGSQVADLYFVLSIFCLPQTKIKSLVQCFESAFHRASEIDWPDLAKEMGLTTLDAEKIAEAIKLPEKDDKVCVIKCGKYVKDSFVDDCSSLCQQIVKYDLLKKEATGVLILAFLIFLFFLYFLLFLFPSNVTR